MTQFRASADSPAKGSQESEATISKLAHGSAGIVSPQPSGEQKRFSYLPPVLDSRDSNTVFYWIDVLLQKVRDHRVPFPRSSYCLAMPMVAGYLAARAVTQRGHDCSRTQPGPGLEDFASGFGADLAAALARAPAGADPHTAYGKAFATVTEHLLDCSCVGGI